MTIETVRVVPFTAIVVSVLVLVRTRFARGADIAESGRREPLDDAPAAPPDGGEEDTPASPTDGWNNTPAAPAGEVDTPAAPAAAAAAAELPASVCSLFCANQRTSSREIFGTINRYPFFIAVESVGPNLQITSVRRRTLAIREFEES